MLAYANQEALIRTRKTRRAHFFSRSRQEIWEKGATSGNYLSLSAIRLDCDGDALVYEVKPAGPACHTGARSCFFRTVDDWGAGTSGDLLQELYAVIQKRQQELPEDSYVASLLSGPRERLLRKVGEEATEVILAAVEPDQPHLIPEIADLWFHTMVVMVESGKTYAELLGELETRRR